MKGYSIIMCDYLETSGCELYQIVLLLYKNRTSKSLKLSPLGCQNLVKNCGMFCIHKGMGVYAACLVYILTVHPVAILPKCTNLAWHKFL